MLKIRPQSDVKWNDLIAHLQSLPRFLYYHNPGNAGDQLIYMGMCDLFRRHQIEFEEFSEEKFADNKHVVFGGGGNLVEYYPHCREFIKTHFDAFETFTLLPHTVAKNEELLGQMDHRFFIFCRETVSEAHCRKHLNKSAHLFLSDDLAFCIDLKRMKPFSLPGLGLKRDIKWLKGQRKLRRRLKTPSATFFRTDCESQLQHQGLNNFDLSVLIKLPRKRERDSAKIVHRQRICVARALLNQLSRVAQIQTDRLHVSISGALLGKPTELYAGSYYKNKAIFEHSMQANYPNVEFRDSREASLGT